MQPSIPFDTCSQPLCHTGLTIKIIKQQSYPTGENHQYDGYQFPLCRCMNAPYFQSGPDSQHQSNNPYYESNHNLFTCKVYYWQNNKLQKSAKFFTCFLFNFIISFLYFLLSLLSPLLDIFLCIFPCILYCISAVFCLIGNFVCGIIDVFFHFFHLVLCPILFSLSRQDVKDTTNVNTKTINNIFFIFILF